MQKIIFLLFLSFSCFLINASAQNLSFEEYNPKSTLVVPGKIITRAKFPFIDLHGHQNGMATQDMSAVLAVMDSINMKVMVNLSGGSGDRIVQAVANVKKNFPGRFVVFCNVNFEGAGKPGWIENAVAQLETDVKNGAAGLKVFKGLGLSNKDVDGKRLAIDDPRLDPIWAKCGELGIPVLIHAADPKPFWDEANADNERWLELKINPRRKRSATDPAPWEQIIAEQHRMFKKHPKTTFFNAHFGWYANDLGKLSQLLDEMPNMQVEIAAIIAELGRQPANARAFFIKYQDRIHFGKDSWVPDEFPTYFRVLESADEYFPYHKKYHAFWAMYGMNLPDDVLKKVYYKNTLRIVNGIDKGMFAD